MPLFTPRSSRGNVVDENAPSDNPPRIKKSMTRAEILFSVEDEASQHTKKLEEMKSQITQARKTMSDLEQLRNDLEHKEFQEANSLGGQARRVQAELEIKTCQLAGQRKDVAFELKKHREAMEADKILADAARDKIRKLTGMRAALSSSQDLASPRGSGRTEAALSHAEDSIHSLRIDLAHNLAEGATLAMESSVLDRECKKLRAAVSNLSSELEAACEKLKARQSDLQGVDAETQQLRDRLRARRVELESTQVELGRLGGTCVQSDLELQDRDIRFQSFSSAIHLETGRFLPTLELSRQRKGKLDAIHAHRLEEVRSARKMHGAQNPDASLDDSLSAAMDTIAAQALRAYTAPAANAGRHSDQMPSPSSSACKAPIYGGGMRTGGKAMPWEAQLQSMVMESEGVR